MAFIGPLIVYSPSIFFAILFIFSFRTEPRQFRNAIFFLAFLLCFLPTVLMQFGKEWMVVPIVLAGLAAPIVTIIFLFANTYVVVRHEGLRLSTILPALLACAAIGWIMLAPILMAVRAPSWMLDIAGLIILEGVWFFFSFAALLLYSALYRLLPRKRVYQYIIIHGAGLMGDKPTPLLRGRIDKAVELWRRQGERAYFVASGGQGSDEIISEAQAISRYLQNEYGVDTAQIICEDESTTTKENLQFSKRIIHTHAVEHMARATSLVDVRIALVTSDYHVFRASEYAHELHMNADGIGSHTRAYYWPTAFIREFIAVTRAHLWPYIAIAAIWAVGIILPIAINFLRIS